MSAQDTTVHTPPVAWAYGATLDLPARERSAPEAIVVDGWVTRGVVGIGICGADGTVMLDERRLGAGDASRRFHVELLRPDDEGARLVVRTADLPVAGEVIITGLFAMAAPTAATAWSEVPVAPCPWVTDWHLSFGGHAESLAGRVRLATLAGETVDVPWFGGTLELDARAEITRAIAGSGTYEPGLLWALGQVIHSGDAVVMAGANAGVMPAYLAHLVGPDGLVIALEPSPREFARLQGNIPRLSSAAVITPVNAALGAAAGTASFLVAPPTASGRGQLGAGDDAIAVEVTTIDAVAEAAGRPISAIVLDLEGHEIPALEGGTRVIDADLPVIVAEVDGARASDQMASHLMPRLDQLGYHMLMIETGSGATSAFPEMPTGASWALVGLPPRLQSGARIDLLMHRSRLGDDGAPNWVSAVADAVWSADGGTVTAPDIAWEYLAEWGIPERSGDPAGRDVVEVTASATGGPAQFVVVDRADGRIIDVAVIPSALGPVRIPLSQGASPAERALVLRTGAAGGATVAMGAPIATCGLPALNPVLRAAAPDRGDVDDTPTTPGQGIGNFTDALADGINVARLDWLAALHLDVAGRRVVDFGAGIGVFAPFFIDRGARYLGMEGRAANIRAAEGRVPGAEFVQSDLRRLAPGDVPDDIAVGLVFGLLYHLDDPRTLLDALGATPARLLVIETQVCDDGLPVLLAQREPMTENQALDGRGSRPSVRWLLEATRDAGFPCIASTGVPVEHPDFSYASLHDGGWRRDGHNLRVAFVAARTDDDIPAHLVRA